MVLPPPQRGRGAGSNQRQSETSGGSQGWSQWKLAGIVQGEKGEKGQIKDSRRNNILEEMHTISNGEKRVV